MVPGSVAVASTVLTIPPSRANISRLIASPPVAQGPQSPREVGGHEWSCHGSPPLPGGCVPPHRVRYSLQGHWPLNAGADSAMLLAAAPETIGAAIEVPLNRIIFRLLSVAIRASN